MRGSWRKGSSAPVGGASKKLSSQFRQSSDTQGSQKMPSKTIVYLVMVKPTENATRGADFPGASKKLLACAASRNTVSCWKPLHPPFGITFINSFDRSLGVMQAKAMLLGQPDTFLKAICSMVAKLVKLYQPTEMQLHGDSTTYLKQAAPRAFQLVPTIWATQLCFRSSEQPTSGHKSDGPQCPRVRQ